MDFILLATASGLGIVFGATVCKWVITRNTNQTSQQLTLAQHTLDTTRQTLADTQNQYHAIQAEKTDLESKLHASQLEHAKLTTLTEQLSDLKITLNDRDQQIAAQSDKQQTLLMENEGLSQTTKHLKDQLHLTQEKLQTKDSQLEEHHRALSALRAELAQHETRHEERQAAYQAQQQQLLDTKKTMQLEFSNLANELLEKKKQSFSQHNQTQLEHLLKPFREQLSQFQQRVNEVHSESVKGQSMLETELKRVLDVGLKMSSDANALTSALKGNKKTIGNWGEAQLERTLQLAGLLKDEHYATQSHYKDDDGQSRLLDVVLKLPDDKHIVIDSKVSLVDYDRAITADNEEQQREALAAHAQAIKNHIDDLAKKKYADLPGVNSPSFVLMFFPIEPAYIEALRSNKDLFDYGYTKNVVLVSYTTLLPLLRTVAHLWMMEKSHKEAREISQRAGDIYDQVCTIAQRLNKLGNTLTTAGTQYNHVLTALAGQQGLHNKVRRFNQLATKVTKSFPETTSVSHDLELHRLEALLPNQQVTDSNQETDTELETAITQDELALPASDSKHNVIEP